MLTFPQTSNRADWTVSFELPDPDTGDLFDFSAVTEIKIEVHDIDSKRLMLSGSLTGAEIIIPDDALLGFIQWSFPASSMRALCPKTYEVGGTIEDEDGAISQIILGRLPIIDGIMT